MCHLTIAIDQSIQPIARVVDKIADSAFYIRSIRVLPVGRTPRADLALSLGGGSSGDPAALLGELQKLPAILAMDHIMPPV